MLQSPSIQVPCAGWGGWWNEPQMFSSGPGHVPCPHCPLVHCHLPSLNSIHKHLAIISHRQGAYSIPWLLMWITLSHWVTLDLILLQESGSLRANTFFCVHIPKNQPPGALLKIYFSVWNNSNTTSAELKKKKKKTSSDVEVMRNLTQGPVNFISTGKRQLATAAVVWVTRSLSLMI